MAHLTESTANQRFYGNSAAHYKVPRALKSVANSKSAVHYKVPRALKSVANSKSVSNRGTVHYENSAAKVEVDFTRSRSRTESYEVPEYNKGWRKEINEQSDNLSEDYIVPSIKPQTLNSQTVSSAASHQSHGPPVQSEGSASAAASKGATMLASSSVRKLVFFVTVFGVIFIGIIALVLGALTMKEKICYGSCSSDGVDSEEILSMRQQFASIQERFKELKGTALSTINSTTFSTVVNTSQLYEGCATNTSRCTVLPVSDDFRAFPQGPVCTTGSLRIDREGFYAAGVQCSLTSSALLQRVIDENGRLSDPHRSIVVKPVVLNGLAFCECYMISLPQLDSTIQRVQCLLSVTMCPLPLSAPLQVNISTA